MLSPIQVQSWFSLLNLTVIEPTVQGSGRVHTQTAPLWWQEIDELPGQETIDILDLFPFLEVFWDQALDWWQTGQNQLCRSGIWEQDLRNGQTIHLEAAATSLANQPILLIGPFLFDLDKMQDILQKTRQLHLDHEALEKAKAALLASETRQARILQALPDRFALCDRQAHILQHNHPAFQGQDLTWLSLGDLFGKELQDRALSQMVEEQESSWDFQRDIGEHSRTFETRMVPMDQDHWLVMIRDVSEARLLERRKAEFLSIAGHELRTPLTSIKGSLNMIKAAFAKDLPEKALQMVSIARRNSERLVNLVNDLLDLQQIELATRSFEKRSVFMPDLIRTVVEENAMFAHEFKINLQVGDLQDCHAWVDPDAINQVLTNFISNGCKFTKAEGEVSLNLTLHDDELKITVADTGPGIDPKYQDRLFQKFAHIPNQQSGPVKGTGLGLSICKAIIDEHMGRITFDTSPKGTHFHIWLRAAHRDVLA